MRSAKELLVASKDFASEVRWLSWWHLWSTLVLLVGLLTLAICDFPLLLRGSASALAGLVAVRLFVIFHDFQHGAILRDSRLAACLMGAYGMMVLNPPSAWNRSHDDHHKNNSKSFGANIGSYPIITTRDYASASACRRFAYAVARHPITMGLGYLTVFLWRMTLWPFLRNPVRHFDGAVSVLLHVSLGIALSTQGLDALLLGLLIPASLASALGAYLFYAQHNYPSVKLKTYSEWSYVDAALHSSSFMVMGPLMNWFTGNIGYHHVHHLNARIPFYRLPEAMAALKELQSPGTTSLRLRDVIACLRLKVWSAEKGKLVGFNGE
jgi:omega-6 fatty acid desaturase (delta-12 desaturase)